jgi:hypothetical protein
MTRPFIQYKRTVWFPKFLKKFKINCHLIHNNAGKEIRCVPYLFIGIWVKRFFVEIWGPWVPVSKDAEFYVDFKNIIIYLS